MSKDKTVSSDKASNYNNAKTMAKSLRDALADQNITLSHSACLEIVAQQLGFANWNTLSAKLSSRTQAPDSNLTAPAPMPRGSDETNSEIEGVQNTEAARPWSGCSFCGKSHLEVRSLVGGCGGWEGFRARRNPESGERSNVFICDECATLIAKNFANAFGTSIESSGT